MKEAIVKNGVAIAGDVLVALMTVTNSDSVRGGFWKVVGVCALAATSLHFIPV